MRNSFKGALLSGLVFPGLGQIVLKQYRKGTCLMLVTLVGLFMFLATATRQAQAVLDKLKAVGGVPDFDTIARTAAQVTSARGSTLLSYLLLFIIFCWFFSIIDAYRIGRKMDTAKRLVEKQPFFRE
jgi:TM2 domain-containing membrane protein YozV